MPESSAAVVAAGLRPEAQLLLCCARTRLEPVYSDRIRTLLREEMDWTYLMQTAFEHGVMPLLYQNLHTTCPTAVPPAALAQLREQFRANARRNLFLTGELLKLLHLLKTQGISAIPYKGPALAWAAYGNLALRQFVDLDILVQPQDVLPAKALLLAQGYQPRLQLTGAEEAILLQTSHQYGFWRDDGQISIELQWGFAQKYFTFHVALEQLWTRLEPMALGGREVLTLSPEDLLLLLCVHGAKHFWGRLGWICDVAEHIRRHERLDWAAVSAQARQLGGERMLWLGLCLASQLVDATLPGEISNKFQADAAVRALAGRVCQQHFANGSGAPMALGPHDLHLLQFKMRERLRDKAMYCLRLATTPTVAEHVILPLPPTLFFVYNLLRPIRLLRKYRLSSAVK